MFDDASALIVARMHFDSGQTLTEEVYQAIRQAIITGELSAQTRVNEYALAQCAHISRTPIRHAMRRLLAAELGYLRKGAVYVNCAVAASLPQVFAVRQALDSLAVTTAQQQQGKKDERRFANVLLAARQADAAGNIDAVQVASRQFNALFYQLAAMPHLTRMSQELSPYFACYRAISLADAGRRQAAMREHEQLAWSFFHEDTACLVAKLSAHEQAAEAFVAAQLPSLK
ncbi:GntR family transcriptional regulator [Lacticaseibacillus baoqingensis]|uniref:GntR family transcriptional regulator n=1 Tax=Lacticaseibacillus baoqingensis TaxID=2486013 RepID=A0ABW4E8J5_9LACO|nr:GntR family transcriptional regulator [Lacticaseibacillus baoqingensis]